MKFPKLFGRKQEAPLKPLVEPVSEVDCLHLVLAPRWDNVQDIGKGDRAVGYRCTACGASLSLEQGVEAQARRQAMIS